MLANTTIGLCFHTHTHPSQCGVCPVCVRRYNWWRSDNPSEPQSIQPRVSLAQCARQSKERHTRTHIYTQSLWSLERGERFEGEWKQGSAFLIWEQLQAPVEQMVLFMQLNMTQTFTSFALTSSQVDIWKSIIMPYAYTVLVIANGDVLYYWGSYLKNKQNATFWMWRVKSILSMSCGILWYRGTMIIICLFESCIQL